MPRNESIVTPPYGDEPPANTVDQDVKRVFAVMALKRMKRVAELLLGKHTLGPPEEPLNHYAFSPRQL